MRRPRITVARLMVAVAIAGACMGACRVAPAVGLIASFWAGPTIVRTYAVIDCRRAAGQVLVQGQIGGVLLDSMVVALIFFLTAGLIFVGAFFVVVIGLAMVHAAVGSRVSVALRSEVLCGVVAGLFAVAAAAYLLRRDLCPSGEGEAALASSLSGFDDPDAVLASAPDPPGLK